MTRMSLWFLAGLALVVLGFFVVRGLLSRQEAEAPIQRAEVPKRAVEAPTYVEAFDKLRGVRIAGVDLRDRANQAVLAVRKPLNELIRHETTAQGALPELTQAASQLAELIGLQGQLTPETRKAMADSFAAIRPRLDDAFEQAVRLPGVGPMIQPALGTLRSKFDALAQTGPSSSDTMAR